MRPHSHNRLLLGGSSGSRGYYHWKLAQLGQLQACPHLQGHPVPNGPLARPSGRPHLQRLTQTGTWQLEPLEGARVERHPPRARAERHPPRARVEDIQLKPGWKDIHLKPGRKDIHPQPGWETSLHRQRWEASHLRGPC